MDMRLTLRLALLAASLLLVVVLAGTASATVHAVHTDKFLYSLSDTATITVDADDGDTVSVQVSRKKGKDRQVVWNSSAKTVPMDSSDGDAGYVTFAWDISSHNSGRGAYTIQVFIGGDPTTGIPTSVSTFVVVAFSHGGGKSSSLSSESSTGNESGTGANATYSLEELEDMVAQGNITPEQEQGINRLFEGEGQGIPPSISGTGEPSTNKTPAQPVKGGAKVGTSGAEGQSAEGGNLPEGASTPPSSGASGANPISTLLNFFKAFFGV